MTRSQCGILGKLASSPGGLTLRDLAFLSRSPDAEKAAAERLLGGAS
jgi:hypothetical protein